MAKGKTLWEMLLEKLAGPVELEVYNPLRVKIGSATSIDDIDWRDLNFFVREIREYRRKIGPKQFVFVDYVLHAKPLGKDEVLVRLRLNPADDPDRAAGPAHHVLLLQLYDELAYSEDFHRVVTDDTRKFQVLQDGAVTEEFHRLHDVASPYQAEVAIVKDTDRDQKAERDEVERSQLEYWDYVRERPGEPAEREYLFIEMDRANGWFQLWKGRELDPRTVMVF